MEVELLNVKEFARKKKDEHANEIRSILRKRMYSKNSLASCVCVTYNRPHLLNELLFCFLNQDHENKELIIVNDQKNVEYHYNDSRVKIFNVSERFATLGEKRQFANTKINGDFMFTMDDDDIFFSHHLSTLIDVHLRYIYHDIIAPKKMYLTDDNENIRCDYNNCLLLNGCCVKREYVDKHKFPKINKGEDIMFTNNAKLKFIDYETSLYYRHGIANTYMTKESFDNDFDGYDIMGENGESTYTELIRFKLKPELSEKTKRIYK